ncbi:MAG: ABC transporter substrate-binding protein [Chloroflexi bacterium]|nr:ABC transporter substrate-binding protein [Chloroflexota bacterium]
MNRLSPTSWIATLGIVAIAMIAAACSGNGATATPTTSVLPTATPAGPGDSTRPTPTSSPDTTPPFAEVPIGSPIADPPPGFQLYLDEDAGFAFHYPESWEEGPATESYGAEVLIQPDTGGVQLSIYNAVEVENSSAAERLDTYKEQFAFFAIEPYEIVDRDPLERDNARTALRADYLFDREGKPQELHLYLLTDGLRSYIVSVSGTTLEHEAAIDDVERIIASIVTFEPAPYGVARERSITIPWANPITLDPAMSRETRSHLIVAHLFSGLVRFDEALTVQPELAERIELDSSGTVYTFTLRKGITFHDGRPITAEDVRYSLERAADPDLNSPTAGLYLGDIVGVAEKLAGDASDISGIEIVDDRTIKITIDAPKAYFLAKMTYPTASIVDSKTIEPRGVEWWRGAINGSGPFKLNKWEEDEVLVLERFDGYPTPSTLQYAVFPFNLGTSMQLYEADLTDVAFIGGSAIDRALDPANGMTEELRIFPQFVSNFVGFNTQKPPFDDLKVRQAFVMALNRQEMVNVVYSPHVELAKGLLPPGIPGYNDALEGLPFDPVRARELIAGSSYAGADFPPVVYTTAGQGAVAGDIQFMINSWKENLGIDVEVRGLENDIYFYQLDKEVDNLFDYGWIADYPEPQNFLDVLLHSQSHDNNVGGYTNAEFDRLLEEARSETNRERRMALYQEAEQLMITDAAIIPIYHAPDYVLTKPHVQGFRIGPLGIPLLQNVVIGPRN